MKLFYRESGKGKPLIVLHGLYGSSDNWVSIAKELEPFFRVINVDQRNHGHSPHNSSHSYNDLTNDLLELFDELKLDNAILLGHSMGGKVAMQFSLNYPERVSSLIVVDIAPWGHLENSELSSKIIEEHRQIINGLRSIPLEILTSRIQADIILSEWVKAEYVRQFLLKNLKRDLNGSFLWKINLSALSSNITNMMNGIEAIKQDNTSIIKTLFIKGNLSNYIPIYKEVELKKIFANSVIITIKNSGHWVHAEKPKEFVSVVFEFLKPLNSF